MVPGLKVKDIQIGLSMAVAIEATTQTAYVIGINQKSELGLGDKETRKSFTILEELNDKALELVAVGKSGYVIAIGQIVQPETL